MTVRIRKATVKDAEEIRKLINAYASENRMLPRALSEIYENIRDYSVAEDGGEVVGSCALHIFWNDLAELRSLAVRSDHLGRQVGMVREAVEIAVAEGAGQNLFADIGTDASGNRRKGDIYSLSGPYGGCRVINGRRPCVLF